jgi:DNA polymerase III alpha subunit
MTRDQYGQMIFNEDDLFDLIMKGHDLTDFKNMIVDSTVDLESAALILQRLPDFIQYNQIANQSTEDFDHRCQNEWKMPQKYKEMDIAQYILNLCTNDVQLQRCGHELLLYQQHDLFNLLRYLVYLVDVMKENHLIWGVGRGSSVSSYVLYLIGVHRIDSIYYNLDVEEFLR